MDLTKQILIQVKTVSSVGTLSSACEIMYIPDDVTKPALTSSPSNNNNTTLNDRLISQLSPVAVSVILFVLILTRAVKVVDFISFRQNSPLNRL